MGVSVLRPMRRRLLRRWGSLRITDTILESVEPEVGLWAPSLQINFAQNCINNIFTLTLIHYGKSKESIDSEVPKSHTDMVPVN